MGRYVRLTLHFSIEEEIDLPDGLEEGTEEFADWCEHQREGLMGYDPTFDSMSVEVGTDPEEDED